MEQIIKAFQMPVPIKDGDWWNGKPATWSNLPQWDVSLNRNNLFGANKAWYQAHGVNIDGHNGLDFPYKKRTPIVAPYNMSIAKAEKHDREGYGLYVRGFTTSQNIDGNTVFLDIVLGHLDEVVVDTGQNVKQGDLLGYGNSTGLSTANHLHLGIRIYINNQLQNYNNGYFGYVDPMPFLYPRILWTREELEDDNMKTNTFILKDRNSSTVGLFLPFNDESGMVSTCKNFGIDIKQNDDGSVDWSSVKISGVFDTK